jgi:hypothetical protein
MKISALTLVLLVALSTAIFGQQCQVKDLCAIGGLCQIGNPTVDFPDQAIGDVNGSGSCTGLDVTYLRNYFKGIGPEPVPWANCVDPDLGDHFFITSDVNGSCTITGLDVTYMVNYFHGGPALICCPNTSGCRAYVHNPW